MDLDAEILSLAKKGDPRSRQQGTRARDLFGSSSSESGDDDKDGFDADLMGDAEDRAK